jgi:NlpC/P60 family protein
MKAIRYFLIVVIVLSFSISNIPAFAAAENDKPVSAKEQAKLDKAKKKEKEKERREYVREYEASGKGKLDKVNDYILKFSQKNMFDPRSIYFDVTAEVKDKVIHLKGAVMFEGQKIGVVDLLEKLKFKSINADALMVLPDPALEENIWGLVSVPVLGQYKDITNRNTRLNEYTYGTGIQILMKSKDGAHAYIQGPEGYLGWVSMSGVKGASLADWQRSKLGPYAFMKESVVVNPSTGEFKITDWNLSDDELKSLVAFPKSSLQLMNHKGEIVLIDGSTVTIDKSLYTFQDPAANPLRKEIIRMAETYLDLRDYVLAGTTGAGVDCSGLCTLVYRGVGIPLARDSSQQVIGGEIVGTHDNYGAVLPGDIVFFTRHPGKVFHTGIYLNDGKFIQTSPRFGVSILSLNPVDSNHTKYLSPRVESIRRYIR